MQSERTRWNGAPARRVHVHPKLHRRHRRHHHHRRYSGTQLDTARGTGILMQMKKKKKKKKGKLESGRGESRASGLVTHRSWRPEGRGKICRRSSNGFASEWKITGRYNWYSIRCNKAHSTL